MRTSDFDYPLPEALIAQAPAPERDRSRLLVYHRAPDRIEHRRFFEFPQFLRPGDVLVLNNSRVIPARLRALKPQTGGGLEILLLEENRTNDWWTLLRPGKRTRPGTRLQLLDSAGRPSGVEATVLEKNLDGHYRLAFGGAANLLDALEHLGEIPLPPYITRPPGPSTSADRERYQTVYACPPGSVAAPTAGLHFTPALLDALEQQGVQVCFVTLHVGAGTFAPVKTAELSAHSLHEERFELEAATAQILNAAKADGRRVVAVGTTTVRVLESLAARHPGPLVPTRGRTRIFIYPPFRFQVVDALLTNFHLPQSTLLMLVSALVTPGGLEGRPRLLAVYAEAIRQRYRFFSYGDAMLLV